MKIAFFCGSLEPGWDGVGDYTRRLGAALSQIGHEVLLISLHEAAAAESASATNEPGVLRLRRDLTWKSRIAQAGRALEAFAPDWLSLQFVPYGFHPKGLTFFLAPLLAPLFARRRCHVMLHELWIGESRDYGLKDRLIGALQKKAVLGLIDRLRPAAIHTSNPVYREIVRRNGINASELPLPGNIPVTAPDAAVLESVLQDNGFAPALGRDACLIGGVFGTVHPQWFPRDFLDQLCRFAAEKKKRLILLHVGRNPTAGALVWSDLAKAYASRCHFLALGILSPVQLSALFQSMDFGIATSPWALIDKSGSAAAMLDHGLPVMVTRDDWKLRSGITPEPTPQAALFRSVNDFLADLAQPRRRVAAPSRWKTLAEDFSSDLRISAPSPIPVTAQR